MIAKPMPVLAALAMLAAGTAMVASVAGCGTSGRVGTGPNHTAKPLASAPTASARAHSPAAVSPGPRVRRSSTASRAGSFAGVTVGIDPGHNGRNASDPSYINRPIWNGRSHEACNTTGTATDAGYPESRFTFNVATYLAADLRQAGAHVVMTRTNNHGVGPCVNRRAQIINDSHAAVAIDIHADGGPASGRGFAVLEPVPDGPNDAVVAASHRYGSDVRNAFARTGMPTSTYDGTDGINLRNDLAGLNLTSVPQVLIECGNMRNATDAAMLISTSFQHRAARTIMSAMRTFLASRSTGAGH